MLTKKIIGGATSTSCSPFLCNLQLKVTLCHISVTWFSGQGHPISWTEKVKVTIKFLTQKFSKIPQHLGALPQTPLYTVYTFFEKYVLHKVIL